jgi:hypothetical protein
MAGVKWGDVKVSDPFVHKYRWSHSKRRRKYRRLLKEGKVAVVWQNKEGRFYRRLKPAPKEDKQQ